jgi:hypothetical protein
MPSNRQICDGGPAPKYAKLLLGRHSIGEAPDLADLPGCVSHFNRKQLLMAAVRRAFDRPNRARAACARPGVGRHAVSQHATFDNERLLAKQLSDLPMLLRTIGLRALDPIEWNNS